jgi:hypothetical protein
MIISELCSNGDLFDYIRNEKAHSLHKVVCKVTPNFLNCPHFLVVETDARHCARLRLPSHPNTIHHPPGL